MKNPVTIFYGFSEESSSIKSKKLTTPNNYENFLSSLNIAIPNEFNPKVKEEFYYDLINYYANIWASSVLSELNMEKNQINSLKFASYELISVVVDNYFTWPSSFSSMSNNLGRLN